MAGRDAGEMTRLDYDPRKPRPSARRARPIQRESAEQKTFILWAHLWEQKYPPLQLLHSIPNGGARSKGEAGKMKGEGVKSGVPDLCLPYPRPGSQWPSEPGSAGLYLEMKAPKPYDSPISENQQWWIDNLRAAGYTVVVCCGYREAAQAVCDYLDVKITI